MQDQPLPLAQAVARLRLNAQAHPAPLWLPDALHAMIVAALASIFGRLEDMIRLWQAGLLPPLVSRTDPTERRSNTPPTRDRVAPSRARSPRRRRAETKVPCPNNHRAPARSNRPHTIRQCRDGSGTPSCQATPFRTARAPPARFPFSTVEPLSREAHSRR